MQGNFMDLTFIWRLVIPICAQSPTNSHLVYHDLFTVVAFPFLKMKFSSMMEGNPFSA